MEITKDVFRFVDEKTGNLLVDEIKDEAKSKGTGKWTSQVAMDLEIPIPTIDAAVASRNLSKLKALRTALSESYPASTAIKADETFIADFRRSVLLFNGLSLCTRYAYAYRSFCSIRI